MKKKKIISRKKNESLNFAKSNAHRKTNAGGSFETQNFFFSLTSVKARIVVERLESHGQQQWPEHWAVADGFTYQARNTYSKKKKK